MDKSQSIEDPSRNRLDTYSCIVGRTNTHCPTDFVQPLERLHTCLRFDLRTSTQCTRIVLGTTNSQKIPQILVQTSWDNQVTIDLINYGQKLTLAFTKVKGHKSKT